MMTVVLAPEKKPLRFLQNFGAVGCSNFNRVYSALMVIGCIITASVLGAVIR